MDRTFQDGSRDRKEKGEFYDTTTVKGYKQSLETMLRMMWSQASGVPTGNHGLFLRYHIEAITMEGITRKKSHQGLEKAGSIIEGVFRSLNNLLERFHQSFFFYVLPSTSTYVSIGLYMPPFGLICAAGLIKTVAIWVTLSHNAEADDEKATVQKLTKQILLEDIDGDEENEEDEEKEENSDEAVASSQKLQELLDEVDEPPKGLLSIIPLILISVLMGVLCYTGPTFITEVAPPFRMRIEDTVAFGLLALFTASLFFPKMVNKKSKTAKRLAFDWELLKSLGLIFQSLVLFTIALMNISLAFYMAAVLVPVTVIAHPSKNRLSTWIQKILVFLVSPGIMIFLAALVTCLDDKYKNVSDLLGKSWDTTKQGLLLTLIDNYFFGSWMYPLFSLVVLPNWLMFWGIVHCEL